MGNGLVYRGETRFADRRLWKWMRGLLAVIGLITVLAIATPIDSWWAHAYAGPIVQPKGDVLILLSAANDDEGFISYSSYWRARYALLAWKTGGFKTIVITGGGGPGIRDFLAVEGIPRNAMVAEWKSTSTRENGINTAQLVRGMPGRKVLLTSDFHMFRAVRVFRKLGVEVTPDPAPDVMKVSEHWYGRFSGFESMVIETTKIVYYRLRGWI
jgi:uncharacterized SAM-binding protein YcdF (DUF218 family)